MGIRQKPTVPAKCFLFKPTRMRFVSILFLLLPVGSIAAFLPEPIVVSTDLTFTSDDVFRGIRVAQKSFQPTIEVSSGDLYLGFWGNFPTDAAQERRLNYYGGVGVEIPDFDFIELDTGFTLYHYPGSDRDRTWEFYLGANFSFPNLPTVLASAYYFYDFDLESHVGEGAVTYLYSLERIGIPGTLDFSVYGGVQGTSGSEVESYHYYGGAIALPFSVTAFSRLTATIGYGTAEKYTFGPGERGKTLFGSLGYSTMF